MTCKDCLHYEACKNTYNDVLAFNGWIEREFDRQSYVDAEIGCDNFTNRSEWVHLPCKVGDILYFVKNNTDACWCGCCDKYDGYDSYCYLKNISYPNIAETPVCNKQFMEIVECTADLMMIVENINKFDKTVFLTREEAEKALEGKE